MLPGVLAYSFRFLYREFSEAATLPGGADARVGYLGDNGGWISKQSGDCGLWSRFLINEVCIHVNTYIHALHLQQRGHIVYSCTDEGFLVL